MAKIIFTYFLLIFTTAIDAQTSVFAENNIRTGFIVNNFLNYADFPKSNPVLINEFKIGHKTLGSKDWHQEYNYPEIAISLFSGSLGNKREFGYLYGLMPNISFDIKSFKHSTLQATLGWGLTYITKPYDSITNPHNILLGSHLNHLAMIALNYRYNFSKNFCIQVGGAYIHASNGHYQVPNGGMNIGTISIGMKKYFGNSELQQTSGNQLDKKKTNINLSFAVGEHEFAGTLQPVGTPKYNIYNVSIFAGKQYNRKAEFVIGFTGKYYKSFEYYITERSLFTDNIFLKSSILTFFIGNEFKFGHFAIFTWGGLNIYSPFVKKYVYKNDFIFNINYIYELYISTKMGMKYYLLNPDYHKFNIYISWAIKANFGNADFTEISSGIVF